MRLDNSHEEPDLGERGAAVDRTHGRFVQIRVGRRRQGAPLFPMLEEKQQVCVDPGVRRTFVKLKKYLASPPMLCKPELGTPLRLYFAVIEKAISSVLLQEQDQVQRAIYFVGMVLQGPEVRYQALEKAALAVVFSARRLRHYFQTFTVIVMTDLPIRKVLQKPDVAGRMVR